MSDTLNRTVNRTFYECGICGQYHPIWFDGDCRDDIYRCTANELDDQFGPDGWDDVEKPL